MKFIFSYFVLIVGFQTYAQILCDKISPSYTGYCISKHVNGQTSEIKEFKNGEAVGIWMTFDEQGKLLKQLDANAKSDSLNAIYVIEEYGFPTENNLQKEQLSTETDESIDMLDGEPSFSGNLTEWIGKNLEYPTICGANVTGKVYVKFIVEKDGSITNIEVVKEIEGFPEYSKAVIDMIKKMPKWIPPKNNGKAFRSYFILPISFAF